MFPCYKMKKLKFWLFLVRRPCLGGRFVHLVLHPFQCSLDKWEPAWLIAHLCSGGAKSTAPLVLRWNQVALWGCKATTFPIRVLAEVSTSKTRRLLPAPPFCSRPQLFPREGGLFYSIFLLLLNGSQHGGKQGRSRASARQKGLCCEQTNWKDLDCMLCVIFDHY